MTREDIADLIAHASRGLVVAPAGFGKTHLIADAVSRSEGRQLILTHTHAGVRSMKDHLKRARVPAGRARVSTIDGWCLRYAASFPRLSECGTARPEGDEWVAVRGGALRTLERKSVRRVVRCSYAGLFVDEYQDCTRSQHAVISWLASMLPCRLFGDPLQGIFAALDPDDVLGWDAVEDQFPVLEELSEPWRWRGHNEELGAWLAEVRRRLLMCEPVNLAGAPVKHVPETGQQAQIGACRRLLSEARATTVGLRKWAPQSYHLARSLRNTWSSMESVECADLMNWAQRIEDSTGVGRLTLLFEFASVCIACLDPGIRRIVDGLQAGHHPQPRRADLKEVAIALAEVAGDRSLGAVDRAFAAMERASSTATYSRRELWSEMRRSLRKHGRAGEGSLRDTAWNLRDCARRNGRTVPKRCLATTLLVKGLEFDHAVLLNAEEIDDAENLYVALTRARDSLTVLSPTAELRVKEPRFVPRSESRTGKGPRPQ